MFRYLKAAALAIFVAAPASAVELVMVEQPGCHYCEQWDREIGPIYPKAAVGQFAPLRRAQLRKGAPEGITYARPARFTPTFILVDDTGTEVFRIEGYPGESFFWEILETRLAEIAGFDPTNTPQPVGN